MTIADIGGFYNANNVQVGSAVGFVAPAGTAKPADSVTVFDSAIWVSPWVSAGATEQGWQVNWNPQTNDINIDEQPTPVDQEMTTATLQFVANLSEDVVQSWQWAFNASKTVQAATTTLVAKTTLVPQPTLVRYAVCIETMNTFSLPRRYYVPKMTSATNVGASFRRSSTQRLIPVTFTSICQLNQIVIDEITGPHT